MRFGLVLAATILATVVACTCTGIGDLEFACKTTADCAPGYTCIDDVCRSGGPDGGPDAGPDGGDGGCVPGTESCTNGQDVDCDGLADCQDPDCDGFACAAGAMACVGGQCRCADGGTGAPTETSCTNNADDDCDGLVDCQDPDCAGASCGNGRTCAGGACACSSGADAGTKETNCTNGVDDDCDGLTDCADPDCQGVACGAGCECVTPAPAEVNCADGQDNDGDQAPDC